MAEPVAGQSQTVQDHSEEQYTRRDQLYQDGRLTGLAYHLLMLKAAAAGSVDIKGAQAQAFEQMIAAAGLTEELKNAAAFPLAQDKMSTVSQERTSQTLSEDTTQNVLDKMAQDVSKTISNDIERTVQEGLSSLVSALKAEMEAAIADVQEGE